VRRSQEKDGIPFSINEVETAVAATHPNGRDHSLHRGSDVVRQPYVDQCWPVVSGQRIHEHSSASSVASSTKMSSSASARSMAKRPSRCGSAASNLAGSAATSQHDEVSDIFRCLTDTCGRQSCEGTRCIMAKSYKRQKKISRGSSSPLSWQGLDPSFPKGATSFPDQGSYVYDKIRVSLCLLCLVV